VELRQPRVIEGSRQERKDTLHGCFSHVAKTIALKGASVDLGSLSTLGQTVEAIIPVDLYDDIVSELQATHNVRVDPIVARDVALSK